MTTPASTPPMELGPVDLREGLTACLAVRRWVDDVAAQQPYDSLDALLQVAAAAASPLSDAEVDEAMADHPRIGDKATGHGASQTFSRAEQSASSAGPGSEGSEAEALAAALAAGNAAYEQKFDRVFLIRAAGRSRAEILAELERRLALDPEVELPIVGAELRDIALRRIPQLFGYLDARPGYQESDGSDAAR